MYGRFEGLKIHKVEGKEWQNGRERVRIFNIGEKTTENLE